MKNISLEAGKLFADVQFKFNLSFDWSVCFFSVNIGSLVGRSVWFLYYLCLFFLCCVRWNEKKTKKNDINWNWFEYPLQVRDELTNNQHILFSLNWSKWWTFQWYFTFKKTCCRRRWRERNFINKLYFSFFFIFLSSFNISLPEVLNWRLRR